MALTEISKADGLRGRVIDIGCGYGRDLELFRSVFAHLELSGLDASPSAIETARRKIPGLRIINADIFQYGHEADTNRYHVAFANYFLHLFSDAEVLRIMRTMGAIVRREGRVVASFVSVRDRHYGKGSKLCERCYEVTKGIPWRFRDREEILNLCRSSGLEAATIQEFEEVELVQGRPDPVVGFYLVAKRPERK
ncbi:MAG: class I SAM-dependent methyltransferase [Acidobacteriia bacterium]|nr:class I SAM-dependent methyltransferase [Terriglobia bacterium]